MRTDSGILQQATVYSFIYSTSYQTENSTLAASSKGQHCVFLPSRSCVLPKRAACSLTPALALPSFCFLLYQQSKTLGRISFVRDMGDTKGRMSLSGSPPGPGWLRMWLYNATADTVVGIQEVERPGRHGLKSKGGCRKPNVWV